MSCGELFLKGASSTFTGYFLIVSLAFMVYGLTTTWYILKTTSVEILDEEFVSVPSLCLLLFGIFLFLIIILGCCAICREIPCCLETYSIFLAFLAASQIAVGVFSLISFSISNEAFQTHIDDDISRIFKNYYENPTQLDTTQEWLKCCGYSDLGPADWRRNETVYTIPMSCCEDSSEECEITSRTLYQDGCSLKLYTYLVGTNFIIGLSLIVTAVTELIGSVMGISLSCAFWRNSRIMWI